MLVSQCRVTTISGYGIFVVVIKIKCPLFAIKHTDTTYWVHNITDHDGDSFYGLVTFNVLCNPHPCFQG
jgi:hypothetical protein